jgi:LAS superfamily LD-carboxypeptidase LdcB
MRYLPSLSASRSALSWPLLPAPLLNGSRLALRPALTSTDRRRYAELDPSLPLRKLKYSERQPPRWLRADLIEDKQRGGIIGSHCVLAVGTWKWMALRLHAMHDTAAVRAEVLRLVRSALPDVHSIEEDDDAANLTGEDIDTAPTLARSIIESLDIPATYAETHRLAWIDEPQRLHYAGRDYVGRTLWLQHGAMQAWQAMRRAADDGGIRLEAVSGFRSIGYQAGILRRKLARGMSIEQVLTINTAPGYSEHHSGRALDIGTPGCAPAEEVFETTPAFAWLRQHAAQFGFRMSYPRGNPHGVIYEPWHWCWHG